MLISRYNLVSLLLLAAISIFAFSLSGSLSGSLSASAQTATTPADLQVLRVTPDGLDVPAANQIVIEFNRPVVPLGRMDREAAEIPVTITPALKCDWRWINTASLACNLPEAAPLQPATRYSVDINPGIMAEDGATLAQTYRHAFLTERPNVSDFGFRMWKSPSLPVMQVVFNQPVDPQSIAQHLFMAVGETRVPLIVSIDPEDTTSTVIAGKIARRVWLVEPERALPIDTHVTLKIEPGLVTLLGPERGAADNAVVEFDTFPEFEYLGAKCRGMDDQEVFVPAGQTPTTKCNPLITVQLAFSAPIDREKIIAGVVFDPVIEGWKPRAEEEAEAPPPLMGVDYRQSHEKGRTYDVWLPSPLKAAQDYKMLSSAVAAPKDIFGRGLRLPISSSFSLDDRKPNFVMDYSDAVLEKNVDSEVPFYVNNLQSFGFDYRRVTADGADAARSVSKDIPFVKNIRFAVPFGVRDMLDGKSGAVYGTLKTTPDATNGNPTRLFAQVTPWQVHLKLGHFNTIAWVTDMATGAPVAGAKVSFYVDALTTLGAPTNVVSAALTDEQGVAQLPGTDKLDPDLSLTQASNDDAKRYFLRVDKGADMALLPISYSYIIDNYRTTGSDSVYPTNRERYGHMNAWGTTAQGIYRAGDLIQYKLFVRDQDNQSFVAPPAKGYRLKVIDPMGKVVHEVKDVQLSEFGGTSGSFTVPKEGAVGWYKFKLIALFAKSSPGDYEEDEGAPADAQGNEDSAATEKEDLSDKKSWIAMRVLVSDFTPSPFKVSNQLNGDSFHAGDQVEVATRAELFSGGAYTDAASRITAILDASTFTSSDPLAAQFQFDSFKDEASTQQIFQKIDSVNNKGESMLTFSMGTPKIVYGKLMVESAVADDRGKYVTNQARADYVGVDRLVGLKSNEWLYTVGKPAEVQHVVVDERGKPVRGTVVDIKIEHEVVKAARVKGAGNAYLMEYNSEWEAAGSCNGVSEEAPLTCTFTPAKSGSYRAVATIKDTKGNDHATTYYSYAVGSDYVMWDNGSDSSLEVIPQSVGYKVGDTARYLVKNPYPGAKALVTIERYGVIDRFVQTFDSSTPIVEFKVKPEYVPGFYLSVVIVSPRVEKPLGEGQVDLGKPTYRMGYATVPVSDPYKEMLITAKADREIYKPREKVTVSLHAEPRFKDKKEPIELTVVVLDESVLALVSGGLDYFDPYKGFYKLDSLDLRNYSLLTRLIGRQRFEKKGANPGGDGGVDVSMRSLFKFVSYWNAELKTDENGNATVTFDAPDNLTGWRVLAIATTPTDRFGLGNANFKVNRPTEVRPVMPNQVMEGDVFNAGFSVMNRTDKTRTLEVTVQAKGGFDKAKTPADLIKTVTLEPFKRTTVFMPIATTTSSSNRLSGVPLEFEVTAGDDADRDGVLHKLEVRKRGGLEVAANYSSTTQANAEESISFPKNMVPGTGSVSVVASPTVIGNISGAFKYMEFYPYICWEQRLSKAVMASQFGSLKDYLPAKVKWNGSEALPQSTLDQATSFQAPNGGMAYFRAQDEYADPYLSAYTALSFNWLRRSGHKVPEAVEAKLHAYLQNLLKNDAVPSYYSQGMTSTVRAVALAALAENGKATLADLERYQVHVAAMSLFGKSHFLKASLKVQGGEKFAPDIAKMMLATSSQTGGKFAFNETLDDGYSRILASPMRENCAVLDAFVAYGEREDGKKLVGDVPLKLVRTITQSRKNRDYWQSTQENMFCANALIEFSRAYEKEKPNMTVKAAMDGKVFGNAKFTEVRNPAVTISRANDEKDVGRKTSVKISRSGAGRLYYSTRLTYALPLQLSETQNAGIEVRREYSVERDGKWMMLKSSDAIKRGELVRVDLFVSVPAARNFVVVDDPVPGGLEPVNRDLATTSEVDARKGDYVASAGSYWFKHTDWIDFGLSRWSFYHQELRQDSVRYYSDYLPQGNYRLSYVAQAIATGTFSAMPTMVQEMYDPDVYGKTEGFTLKIGEQTAAPDAQQ